MIKRRLLVVVLIGSFCSVLAADEISFRDPRWMIEGEQAEVVTMGGREALYLKNGRATLPDAKFENGVIEFQMMLTPERGFHGIRFRNYGEDNGEFFYVRPHLSGMEDANQYTPVFNGVSGWQLYHGTEFSAPTNYRFGEWIHVKIVVSGEQAEIFIESDEPVLQIARLKNRSVAGPLRLVSGFAPVHFAGFRYEKHEMPTLDHKESVTAVPEEDMVMSWSVSTPFDASRLSGVTTLSSRHLEDLQWHTLEVEERGYANLARVARWSPETNTVFARLPIETSEMTVRTVTFGYSDRVKVYLNGKLLYEGDNGYRTRDYRYLGTIGLFDSIPLRLSEGANELLFAVSESFGGWGIMARIEEAGRVTLSE